MGFLFNAFILFLLSVGGMALLVEWYEYNPCKRGGWDHKWRYGGRYFRYCLDCDKHELRNPNEGWRRKWL